MRPIITRRDFLQRATCAGALLAFGSRVGEAQGGTGQMYLSLNSSVTRGVGWPDLARLAARVGFDGVDWSLGAARTAGVDATKALFAELKIRPSITNLPMARPLPFQADQAAFDQALVQLADDAAFTAAIGCDRMVLVLSASGPRPMADWGTVVR